MSENTESCLSCKFWRCAFGKGDCRRFPPVDIVRQTRNGDSVVNTEFPWTDKTEWCGEYVKGEVK